MERMGQNTLVCAIGASLLRGCVGQVVFGRDRAFKRGTSMTVDGSVRISARSRCRGGLVTVMQVIGLRMCLIGDCSSDTGEVLAGKRALSAC